MDIGQKRKRSDLTKLALNELEKSGLNVIELGEMGLLDDIVRAMLSFRGKHKNYKKSKEHRSK